jgi:hypothetical protein
MIDRCSKSEYNVVVHYFCLGPAIPSPPATHRKAPKPPLVCGFVTTKRPNRVGEEAGNAQGAEPRLPLKRSADGGARRRPTTEQRSCSCVPLDCGVHTHQAGLNKSKINIKVLRRTCVLVQSREQRYFAKAHHSYRSHGSSRGSRPNFLGCSLGPFPFASAIKSHQKSTCNSAGSSVGSLAPHRATRLQLGGAAVSCQYFPCSFVLAPRAHGLRLGVKAPLPLRARYPWGPPWGRCSRRLPGSVTRSLPFRRSCAAAHNSSRDYGSASHPRAGPTKAGPVANEVTGGGGGVWACFGRPRKRKPTGAFLWLSYRNLPHLKSQSTSLSLTAACFHLPPVHSDEKHPIWAYLDTRTACHLGTCVS